MATGRPRKEGLDWFQHDVDAAEDEKVCVLRARYGNDGYAFYFVMLERIYRTPRCELAVDEDTELVLAQKCGVSVERWQAMLATALRWNPPQEALFDPQAWAERRVLTSDAMKRRASAVLEKRARMAARYRQQQGDDSEAETPDPAAETRVEREAEQSTGGPPPPAPAGEAESPPGPPAPIEDSEAETGQEAGRNATRRGSRDRRDRREEHTTPPADGELPPSSLPEITEIEREALAHLRTVKDYPFHFARDLTLLRRLAVDYPTLDILAVIKSWAIYKLDKPLLPNSNARSQLANSFAVTQRYQRERQGRRVAPSPISGPRPAHEVEAEEAAERIRRTEERKRRLEQAAGGTPEPRT